MHSLEADGISAVVRFSSLANHITLMAVSGVNLHGRLGGIYLEGDVSALVNQSGGRS